MCGHGFRAVGDALPVAVCRAACTEKNASALQKAFPLGGTVTCLDADEARLSDATNRGTVDRPWAPGTA